jgi:hypothetical protein
VLRRFSIGWFAIGLALLAAGCAAGNLAQSSGPANIPGGGTAAEGAPAQSQTASAPISLPFKGHLAQGDPADLPPAVAAALSPTAPVAFLYREELTHDHYTVPLVVSAFDPLTYAGYPLGRYGVTAFGELAITDGSRVLGDYTAKVRVARNYTLYYQPTYLELERQARAEVRQKIDQQLYRDSSRLAQAAQSPPPAH